VFRSPQINLYVQDVAAACRFYGELFGFTETFRTPPTGRAIHAEMRLGDFTLGLGSIDSAREMHGVPAGTGPARAELVLWTADIDAAYARVVEQGAQPLTPPHDFIGTLRAGWITDPDGNPIQLVARRSTSDS
jgi:predicted enzyme related to lactoylglutathione lyase